jgi:hypothetical protein
MRKSSATVVFLPLCSRDAKEQRETEMSVEERRRWRVRESTQERERERGRERRACVRCCSRARLSSPGPPRAGMRGPHPRPRYADAKFLIVSYVHPESNEFITLKLLLGIELLYIILSFHIFIHEKVGTSIFF